MEEVQLDAETNAMGANTEGFDDVRQFVNMTFSWMTAKAQAG